MTNAALVVMSLGGTIASVPKTEGSTPTLTADDLVAAVPALTDLAEVRARSFRQVASSELQLADLIALGDEISDCVAAGASGVVVTSGTDTLEEVAFVLDLLYAGDPALVLTGAMRRPGLPGADGPANLLAAARVAISSDARGLGALVVLNDDIHAARFIRKTHTTNPKAFQSTSVGPIGWMTEDRVRIALRPHRRHHLDLAPVQETPRVALVRPGLGDDTALIEHLADLGYAGLVIEAAGGGHVPGRFVGPLTRLTQTMPVVFASRTGSGELLRSTYGFPGSERDLLAAGLISAGMLDGLKARLLLTMFLAAGKGPEAIRAAYADIGYGG